MKKIKVNKPRACLVSCLFILQVLCSTASLAQAPLANQLANNPSPYLALHGKDPVAWQEWNAETFARARRENKLLYVSVGYFACHWCHVMQRESYSNPAIAAELNQHFIPVKVDRELNNGVDDTLQLFSERLNGVAGWPLNAFITPEGYPSFVVLYAPPEQFLGILQKVSARWKADDQAIRKLAQQAAPAVATTPPANVEVTPAYTATASLNFINSVWQEADTLQGGFGQTLKFPLVPQLTLLLEIYAQQPEAKPGSFLRLTLDQMAKRALRDHVGGGFFRYTTDPAWDTPHFEKMLYDNAQLAQLYLQAAEVLHEPAYRDVAIATFDFMLTLQAPAGGLFTSTSAVDKQGREGAVFLWEPQALKALLTPAQYVAAARVWQLNKPRPFEYGYLPAEYIPPTQAERALLSQAYTRLRAAQKLRALPIDTKMSAGLNGLALSAFSQGQPLSAAYRKSATRIRNFLATDLVRGARLIKTRASSQAGVEAELEDYAYVVQGLLDYAEVNSDAKTRALALKLARTAWSLFWSPNGWKREAHSLLATLSTDPVIADGALASPSEMLNLASLRLGDPALVQQVKRVAGWQSPQMSRDVFAYPTRVRVMRALTSAR